MMYDDVGEDKADAAVMPCVVGRGWNPCVGRATIKQT